MPAAFVSDESYKAHEKEEGNEKGRKGIRRAEVSTGSLVFISGGMISKRILPNYEDLCIVFYERSMVDWSHHVRATHTHACKTHFKF